jgi:hypothetical protein
MAGLGDLMSMMKDFGHMRERMEATQEVLSRLSAEGEAGAGMVTATVNGRMELVALHIAPEAVKDGDAALLEDLVKGAVGMAMTKACPCRRGYSNR